MDSGIFKLLHYFVLFYPSCIVLFTFAGFFESVVALALKDRTPYENGFVTLNPLVHINVIGFTILFGLIFGFYALLGVEGITITLLEWVAIFSIRYINSVPLSFVSPVRVGFIILSRIVSFLLLALMVKYAFAYIPFASFSLPAQRSLVQLLQTIASIALANAVMHMIPIYPFNMGAALAYFFPNTIGEFFQQIEEYSFFIIVGIFTLIDLLCPQFFIIGMTYCDHLLSYLVF